MLKVKNTMKVSLGDLIAPHYCCSCGAIGTVFCGYCKFDIISESYGQCIVCLRPLGTSESLCGHCRVPYRRAWCCGVRNGGLEKLIDQYKFGRTGAAACPLVELAHETLPELSGVVVVPVPTIRRHIRQRGFDHAARVARLLAKKRNLAYEALLERKTTTVQHEATRAERHRQASEAFIARKSLNGGVYLLVDDIYTTGATVEFASKALLEAGADEVWVVVLSRQPLEK